MQNMFKTTIKGNEGKKGKTGKRKKDVKHVIT